jgi:hypothetical protein
MTVFKLTLLSRTEMFFPIKLATVFLMSLKNISNTTYNETEAAIYIAYGFIISKFSLP